MSLGLPLKFCYWVDKITFGIFSDQVLDMHYGFFYETSNNDMPTVIFIFLFFIAFVLVWFLFEKILKEKEYSLNSKNIFIVVFFAILFRIMLLPAQPIHENDFYRYLWDGKVSNAGINPFLYPPSDIFMYEAGLDEDFYDTEYEVTFKAPNINGNNIGDYEKLVQLKNQNPLFYERIGHRQVPTIYPPTTQVIFWFISFLKADHILLMKSIFVLFDLGVLWIIICLRKTFWKKSTFKCFLWMVAVGFKGNF